MIRTIIFPLIVVSVVIAAMSCHKSPNEPQKIVTHAETLYVAAGGTGDGTKDAPFGSIQQAMDSSFARNPHPPVLVATGTYNEQLSFRSGVDVSGSRVPSTGWTLSTSDSTTVTGSPTTGPYIAAIASDIHVATNIDHLTLRGPDAVDSGGTSICLLIVNSDSIHLSLCTFRSGKGRHGFNGVDGANGDSNVLGPLGGMGGKGGQCEGYTNSESGAPGNCYPDSIYAGMGGKGGGHGFMGGNGQPGQRGESGVDGSGAAQRFSLRIAETEYFVETSAGTDGASGGFGCGGGGGGGMDWHITPYYLECISGLSGTRGGTGAAGGKGATAGRGGGSSIAVLEVTSFVYFDGCILGAAQGGDGGHGGIGGAGSPGKKGEFDWEAAMGGDGGPGGKGGDGGGGMGGCSFALVMYQSDGVYGNSNFYFGIPGEGGGPANTKGPAGIAAKLYVIQ